MTLKEIVDGLQFTLDMFLFDPTTGETYPEPRNDMDKTTIDACKGAIELLEQQPCEDCIRELIREFDNKHPALFADYMREFNNHPISEIIEYMWDMHDLIEDIKYRLPNEGGAESEDD